MSDPIFISDDDVADVISSDDEIVASVQSAFDGLRTSLAPADLARAMTKIDAWSEDVAQYDNWAAAAHARLSSFFEPALAIPGTQYKFHAFGADLYNQGIDWGRRLLLHAQDAQKLGAGLGALPVLPEPQHVALPSIPKLELPTIGDDTKLLIGGAILLGLILALKH